MNGIEILSQSEVVTATAYNTTACAIAFWVVMAICVVIGVFVSIIDDNWSWLFLAVVFGILISLLVLVVVVDITEYPTAYETYYKVTVDDNVSMNEFNEKYEIVSQEGKIYTIRERK